MRVGLTLGKFAPLHKGHQLVIETALREVDRLIVVVYECDEIAVPIAKRARWIRTLYPSVEVIEAPDGPTAVGYTPEIIAMHDDFLRNLTRGRGVTHFYSSERYGEHVSRALNAIDRRVDMARTERPISGTLIRSNPYEHRRAVDAIVYRDLIDRIVLVGAPSTGKSTLAVALAERFQTVSMPEYGREYWEKNQVERRLTLDQLVEIAEEHRRREDEMALEAKRYLFVDTDATTTRHFAMYYHGRSDPRLDRMVEEARERYQRVIVCGTGIPYDDTDDRSGEANRELMQSWILRDLAERDVPYFHVEGTVQERVASVEKWLGKDHAR